MTAGPIQPMWNSAQNNLRGMRGEVSSWNPDFPVWMCDQSINNRLRAILDRRIWSGLLVKDQLVIPDQYTTGTVTVTRDSATVTGVSTAWPTNDKVNTTLSVAITETGVVQDITPAAMTNINTGDWVTIAGNTGTEEQLLVLSTTSTTFKTKPAAVQSAAVTIWKSSLVRQQFRVNETAPWYTVKGVSTSTSLKLNETWGGVTASAQSYSIFVGYVVFGNDCKFVHEVANLNRRYRLGLHMPQGAINAYDPQRSATESTYLLVDFVPDEIGRPQYELYPRPTSAQVFSCLYYRVTGVLSDDDDTPPPFIRSDVLVMGAISDALRYRPKTNTFYDAATALTIARDKEAQFEREIGQMQRADDGIFMQNLQWQFSQWPLGSYGSDFMQSHDIDSLMGNV